MKTLKLADNLKLPLEVVTQTIAILAKRRAGKSYTMRRLVEELVGAGQQVVLVDPKGDQWGIRSSADGKSPGLPIVILGGERADVKLEPSAGEVVAKLVVEERVSVLLDLSLFRKHEVATFMTGFLENLYRLKARETFRTPVMLVIDEADAIAPQKPQKGEERMLGAAEDIVRRGGQRGIGCVLVTQRSAVLNKNVLTQAQVLVALRTIAPQDLEAMKAWIDVHGTLEQQRTLMESLPSLPVGDAWFWSPGWPTVDGIFKRVHVSPIETFDSGATPAPGEKRVEPKNPADVDLEALQRQMAATIEKAKADDPRELKKQIAELRKELASKVSIAPKQEKLAREPVEKPVLTDADRALIAKLAEGLTNIREFLQSGHQQLFEEFCERASKALQQFRFDSHDDVAKMRGEFEKRLESKGLAKILEKLERVSVPFPSPLDKHRYVGDRPFPPMKGTNAVRTPPPSAHRFPAVGNGEVKGKALEILNGLAELETLGAREPQRVQVAFLAGYTNPTSTGFVKAMSTLSSGGFITYPSPGAMALTDAGRSVAQFPEVPRSSAEIQQRVLGLIGGKAKEILTPLIDVYPNPMERMDVATAAGYTNVTSTGFVKALSRLSSLGFVKYPSPRMVVASPILFLEA